MYEKRDARYPLAIEQGTATVPADGKFHVVVNNKIVLSTKVLDYAILTFKEKREELRISEGDPDPTVLLARERANREVRAMRGEAVGGRERRNRGGGRGGRGGV